MDSRDHLSPLHGSCYGSVALWHGTMALINISRRHKPVCFLQRSSATIQNVPKFPKSSLLASWSVPKRNSYLATVR